MMPFNYNMYGYNGPMPGYYSPPGMGVSVPMHMPMPPRRLFGGAQRYPLSRMMHPGVTPPRFPAMPPPGLPPPPPPQMHPYGMRFMGPRGPEPGFIPMPMVQQQHHQQQQPPIPDNNPAAQQPPESPSSDTDEDEGAEEVAGQQANDVGGAAPHQEAVEVSLEELLDEMMEDDGVGIQAQACAYSLPPCVYNPPPPVPPQYPWDPRWAPQSESPRPELFVGAWDSFIPPLTAEDVDAVVKRGVDAETQTPLAFPEEIARWRQRLAQNPE